MKKSLLIFPALLIFLLTACSSDKSSHNLKFKKTRKYTGRELVYDQQKLDLGSPSMMVYADSALIVYSDNQYLSLSMIDLRNNTMTQFGKTGNGLEGLSMPVRMSPVSGNRKCFEVMDFVKKKIFVYHVDSCRANLEQVVPVKELPVLTSSLKGLSVSDSMVLNIGLFSDQYAFLLCNNQKDTVSQFGNYDFNPQDQNSPMNKALTYQGRYAVQGTHFIQACNEAPVIQIFSLKDPANITLQKSFIKGFADYISANDTGYASIIESGNPAAYCDITTSADRIYLLYSGKTFKQYKANPDDTEHCSEIHVLDWDGNFLEKMILDKEVVNIALSGSGKRIYAIAHTPDPQIIWFELQ